LKGKYGGPKPHWDFFVKYYPLHTTEYATGY